MENLNINYIIGGILLLAVLIFAYLVMSDSNKSVKTAEQNTEINKLINTEENLATTTSVVENKTESPIKKEIKNMNQETYKVTMTTNYGTINIQLNSKIAPKTVENFVKLANAGYYNGIKFHRVINGFMIQGGDPLTKDDSKQEAWGTGGPGYKFADEIFDQATYQKGYKRGILAMANSGPNTNGSQFFIMHKDYPLPPSYTIFGEVTSGLETVDKIANVETLYPGQLDRPVSPVIINKVSVE